LGEAPAVRQRLSFCNVGKGKGKRAPGEPSKNLMQYAILQYNSFGSMKKTS
jgi:hypothetical protein